MLNLIKVSAAAAVVGLTAASASAQMIYVDADKTTNTAPSTAFTTGTNDSADDNLWSLRTGFSSGGTIYEAGQGDGEDAPEIITTIGGLAPNTEYTVYVHFWDGSGDAPDWNVRAGFESGNTTAFANPADAADIGATAAVLASELDYAVAPTVFTEADRTMFAGLVGTVTTNDVGALSVYADDLPSTIGVNQRSWYDGISYEAVPEPTSLAMVGLGAMAFLRRRRA